MCDLGHGGNWGATCASQQRAPVPSSTSRPLLIAGPACPARAAVVVQGRGVAKGAEKDEGTWSWTLINIHIIDCCSQYLFPARVVARMDLLLPAHAAWPSYELVGCLGAAGTTCMTMGRGGSWWLAAQRAHSKCLVLCRSIAGAQVHRSGPDCALPCLWLRASGLQRLKQLSSTPVTPGCPSSYIWWFLAWIHAAWSHRATAAHVCSVQLARAVVGQAATADQRTKWARKCGGMAGAARPQVACCVHACNHLSRGRLP